MIDVIASGGFVAVGALLAVIDPGSTATASQLVGSAFVTLGALTWRLVTAKAIDSGEDSPATARRDSTSESRYEKQTNGETELEKQ